MKTDPPSPAHAACVPGTGRGEAYGDGQGAGDGQRLVVSSWFAKIGEWIRHHTGSLVATSVDFVVMVASVEILGLDPVVGTAAGALCGALTSFLLGRNWVFHRADSRAAGQVLRYAMVAGASLALNALGEYLLVRAGLGYVRARVIVAVVVSNLWNYPMHKFFVFGQGAAQKARRQRA
jgi:putative flippase GtrA